MIDFESNTGLVYAVFNETYQECRRFEDDLIQEGMIALWRACQDYKDGGTAAFSTFATIYIRNAMGMFMRTENRHTVHVTSIENPVCPDVPEVTYINTTPVEEPVSLPDTISTNEVLDFIQDKPQYRIVMMKMVGYTQSEIAQELGVTPCSISEQLRGLYQEIREHFEETPQLLKEK